MKKQVLLLDLMNAAHRMRHAFESLATKKGHPTGVLYGIFEMLQILASERQPDAIIAVGESHGRSWRTAICSTYKDDRRKRVEQLGADERSDLDDFYKKQIPDMLFLLRGLNIPYVALPGEGYEADDTLAAIVRSDLAKTADFTIVSTDKDMYQLARDNLAVRVYNPMTKAMVYCNDSGALCKDPSDGRSNIIAPCPFSFVCRRALVGDPSDNVKGVIGIGEKGAAKIFHTGAQTQPELRRQYIMQHRNAIRDGANKHSSADAFSVFLKNMAVMDLTGTMYEAALHKVRNVGTRDLCRLVVEAVVTTQAQKHGDPEVEMFTCQTFNSEARLLRFLRVREFEAASKIFSCRELHKLFREQTFKSGAWLSSLVLDQDDEEEEL